MRLLRRQRVRLGLRVLVRTLAERRAAALARREVAQPAPVPAPEPSAPTKPCTSCGAPVVWTRTVAGRPIPLDPPLRRGVASASAPEGPPRIAVVDDQGRTLQIVEHAEGDIVGRVSHFATCPNAAGHRKPRGERRPARPAERRVAAPAVSALPEPELGDDERPLYDQPQPTEPAGTRCWVSTTPAGPECTVQTTDGQLRRGYRVPEGWRRGDDLSLVSVGRCVSAVWVDAMGRWVSDGLGRPFITPAPGGGTTIHREPQADDRLVVVDAVPPPLTSGRTP